MSPWAAVVPIPEMRSAVRAARRVARMPVRGTPPLILHGPPGCGKSTVVAALLAAVAADPAGRTIRSLPANDLDRDADADPFADLADCDLTVIEDLQHLPASAAAAVERLLDMRGRRRLATVITAGDGPARLSKLPRRLTNRLAAGLVVRIDAPSADSRRKLVAAFAIRRGVRLTPAACAWIADRAVGDGARPLLGAVERLKPFAPAGRGPLDEAAVAELLAADRPASADRVVARVAAAFGVKAKDLLGPSRLRTVLVPRQVAMYLARKAVGLPLARVGELVGGRNHATVLHAVRKIEAALKTDPTLAHTVTQLWTELT